MKEHKTTEIVGCSRCMVKTKEIIGSTRCITLLVYYNIELELFVGHWAMIVSHLF